MLGPKTKKNLEEALAGESMARNKYDWFASEAKKDGYVQMQNIFMETALNEKEHAKLWAKALGLIGKTPENLKHAAEGEHYEYTDMYVRMAKEAKEEGHDGYRRIFPDGGGGGEEPRNPLQKLSENIAKGGSSNAQNRGAGNAITAVISTKARKRRKPARPAPIPRRISNYFAKHIDYK